MFTMYSADCIGVKTNCLYPHKTVITDEASLADAVRRDYVCAEYEGNYRSNDNFRSSDNLAVDCDNDHSDDPLEWKMPADVAAAFPGVPFWVHYSRHHNKPKDGKLARPRFHVGLAINPITDYQQYAQLKDLVCAIFPFFDVNAKDSARFFFGTPEPEVEFHSGTVKLDEFLVAEEFDAAMPPGTYGDQAIPEGRRNATMSRFAGKIVKRYGPTEEAFQVFLEEAAKCDPPLEDGELGHIWQSACRFAKKVQNQEGYIPPDKYKGVGSLKPADYSDIGQAKMVALDCGQELAYTTGTDFIVYDGTRWVESKPKSIGCMESFLDRQLEDAKAALERAKENLLRCGVAE